MNPIEEVRNDFTDGDNYTHIDVYHLNKEEGKTVAIVCNDTSKVFYIDNLYRNVPEVHEAINEILCYL
jgi:hypothetical protein